MANNDVKDMSEDVCGESSSSDEGSESEGEMGSWIGWYCSLKGNEFFCEVDEDYIQDDFNLSGLAAQVPYYEYALELILDADAHHEILTEAQQGAVESAAETLYGLIHARFILCSRGLACMAEKYRSCDFGRCPRVLCNGQPCLPVGLSDNPRQSTVKLFCPRCEDVYYPRSKYHGNLDGAYFGTTFPHLFLMTYPHLRPTRPVEKYIPRIFGFKISPIARNNASVTSNGQDQSARGQGQNPQQEDRLNQQLNQQLNQRAAKEEEGEDGRYDDGHDLSHKANGMSMREENGQQLGDGPLADQGLNRDQGNCKKSKT